MNNTLEEFAAGMIAASAERTYGPLSFMKYSSIWDSIWMPWTFKYHWKYFVNGPRSYWTFSKVTGAVQMAGCFAVLALWVDTYKLSFPESTNAFLLGNFLVLVAQWLMLCSTWHLLLCYWSLERGIGNATEWGLIHMIPIFIGVFYSTGYLVFNAPYLSSAEDKWLLVVYTKAFHAGGILILVGTILFHIASWQRRHRWGIARPYPVKAINVPITMLYLSSCVFLLDGRAQIAAVDQASDIRSYFLSPRRMNRSSDAMSTFQLMMIWVYSFPMDIMDTLRSANSSPQDQGKKSAS